MKHENAGDGMAIKAEYIDAEDEVESHNEMEHLITKVKQENETVVQEQSVANADDSYEEKNEDMTDATSWEIECLGRSDHCTESTSDEDEFRTEQQITCNNVNEPIIEIIELDEDDEHEAANAKEILPLTMPELPVRESNSPSLRPFICFLCEKSFIAKIGLQQHMRKHIGDKPFKCTYCNASFPDQTIFDKHLTRKHSDETPFKCDRCQSSFPTRPTLMSHQLNSHTSANGDGSPAATAAPSTTIQRRRSFRCFICASSFVSQQVLRTHLRQHNQLDGPVDNCKLYKCNRCDSSFSCRSSLVTHKATHPNANPHMCTDCNESFAAKTSLLAHCHREKHTAPAAKQFFCILCLKSFGQRNALQAHLMEHTGEKPINCTQCTAIFLTESLLKKHRKKMHTIQPYKCDSCPKSFASEKGLRTHSSSHGGGPFGCHICEASFLARTSLRAHYQKEHVVVV